MKYENDFYNLMKHATHITWS